MCREQNSVCDWPPTFTIEMSPEKYDPQQVPTVFESNLDQCIAISRKASHVCVAATCSTGAYSGWRVVAASVLNATIKCYLHTVRHALMVSEVIRSCRVSSM
jgi:hypothetical protein